MAHDMQIANIWKRISAWLFDGILTGVIAVAIGLLLSAALGYDGYSDRLDEAYAKYEAQFSVNFEISPDTYESMTDAERENFDAAYEALVADHDAMYAYNMMISLSLVIISLGVFSAVVLWEFVIPLWLGHGRTLGKKIFGLCLVRHDGVKLNTMQLFTRTVLGKFTIETMIPVYILIMIFWGGMGIGGTVLLLVLAVGQIACVVLTRTNSAIHDLLAGTVVVDMASQMIFRTTDDLIAYKKKIAAEQAARQVY